MAGIKEALAGINISDSGQLTADSITKAIDIEGIEKDVTERYQFALASRDYKRILGLFNEKSLVTSVGHFFGLNDKAYIDRAISLLEGELRDELSEALRPYIV